MIAETEKLVAEAEAQIAAAEALVKQKTAEHHAALIDALKLDAPESIALRQSAWDALENATRQLTGLHTTLALLNRRREEQTRAAKAAADAERWKQIAQKAKARRLLAKKIDEQIIALGKAYSEAVELGVEMYRECPKAPGVISGSDLSRAGMERILRLNLFKNGLTWAAGYSGAHEKIPSILQRVDGGNKWLLGARYSQVEDVNDGHGDSDVDAFLKSVS